MCAECQWPQKKMEAYGTYRTHKVLEEQRLVNTRHFGIGLALYPCAKRQNAMRPVRRSAWWPSGFRRTGRREEKTMRYLHGVDGRSIGARFALVVAILALAWLLM